MLYQISHPNVDEKSVSGARASEQEH